MYRVTVETGFSAAHQLRDYQGTTERIHGHNWRVWVVLEGEKLTREGYLVDFVEVQRELDAIRSRYEHELLNDVPPFDRINPTAELLARTIAEGLSDYARRAGVRVDSVEVEEAPGCRALYSPSG